MLLRVWYSSSIGVKHGNMVADDILDNLGVDFWFWISLMFSTPRLSGHRYQDKPVNPWVPIPFYIFDLHMH